MKKNRLLVFLICFVFAFTSFGCDGVNFFASLDSKNGVGKTVNTAETAVETELTDNQTGDSEQTDGGASGAGENTETPDETAENSGENNENPDGAAEQTGDTVAVTPEYTVTVFYSNGNENGSFTVKKGETFSAPQDPVKNNYEFIGWFNSSDLVTRYDFSKPVEHDVEIYAGYKLDGVELTNKITTETIKGVVKITNRSYNVSWGTETYSISQGSGFCFKIDNGCYYILTNCHVAKKAADYSRQKFTIIDYQDNEYEGYLYRNPNKAIDAIAAQYDLACLYFQAESSNVTALPFASENPATKDDVILLGAPKGQQNAITYGVINGYKKVTLNSSADESNVEFDVIESSAYSNNGSSGGPALNSDLQIIGVSFAGNESKTLSYSIPVMKVNEFLASYVYD